jgi:hypothetical protein
MVSTLVGVWPSARLAQQKIMKRTVWVRLIFDYARSARFRRCARSTSVHGGHKHYSHYSRVTVLLLPLRALCCNNGDHGEREEHAECDLGVASANTLSNFSHITTQHEHTPFNLSATRSTQAGHEAGQSSAGAVPQPKL